MMMCSVGKKMQAICELGEGPRNTVVKKRRAL